MKKYVSLKLIVFSFLLVGASVSYSAPVFQGGGGTDSTVAGVGNTASNVRSSAFGYGNIASGEKSSAFGYNNKASGRESLAFGHWNEANGNQSSVFGHGNLTNGFATSAFGYGNSADKEGSSAFGYNNTASGEWSSAFGTQNQANGKRSSVFGNQYKVTGEASGAFGVGKTTWNSTTGKDDYDYVNEGKDSYMIGNYNRIASGSNNNFILGNNVSIGSGIQNSVALGNGSTVSSSNEVSVGSATQKRKITNVADGEVSATSTDAVNGRQLYNAMQNSNNTFKNEVNEKIDNVKNEVRNVGSLSAALAGLHPMQYDPKAPTQVMAALGHYKNKQAVAIGASYYFNDRFMMSTGIALSGEKRTETMANVGFTIKLGKGSGVAYNETPQYVVQNEVKRLTVENQELKEKVNAQGAENKDLKERVQKLEEKLNKLLTTK
ncbi:cell surface protein [Fusobacterium animalis D11]|uniref:Cell surface protein n=1 Tax=Fusobacterium animalis D11 TaxID=556264 RepID=D6BHH2_9FUSO|nr:YadA-like family protein [Fusobacterium nucleatum]EFD81641.2 cell surface protein [Fusobacterium animalis D11]